MKLTVDCILTSDSPDLHITGALAQLLAKGKVTQLEKPLEALICEHYGLQAVHDYPIASIAAVVDGLDVGGAYWLRADAVHLVLQRDCFSLGEPIPLQVNREHAEGMIASLNQHFSQDGLMFLIGNSGAWYLRSVQEPQIKTTLPSVVAGKNIHQFMPQGLDSSKWLAVLNEVQMILFEHPANIAREATGEMAVNSVWFSGGGVMPQTAVFKNDESSVFANSILYQGLGKWAGFSLLPTPSNFDAILQSDLAHVRLHLTPNNQLDEAWFKPILSALKSRKIKNLTLNLGFYEKCLVVEIKPIDFYKFWRTPIWRNLIWRTPKLVMDYLK